MKKYVKAEIKVIEAERVDVITESGTASAKDIGIIGPFEE